MSVKKKIVFVSATLILLLLIAWIAWGNTALELNTYTITSEKIPDAFNGYRIAQVSDLHNTQIGEDSEKLLSMLKDSDPDMIAITGDMIDSRNTNVEIALEFAAEAVKIAPCYYVTGNHESRVSEYIELKEGLSELGVSILDNKGIAIEHENSTIILLGVDDPTFNTDPTLGGDASVINTHIKEIKWQDDYFMILLSHRPELFQVYAENGMDLVLSGHAHGGQFRLPFVGGMIAPHQGLFPDYYEGLYTEGNTNMIVSRGIGNSIIPVRFNNRPEIVLIELKSEE